MNQHEVIESASRKQASVSSIPVVFDRFQGYNDFERKKLKEAPMSSSVLKSHSEVLYTICLKPVMKTTDAWTDAHLQIKSLADCFTNYREFLEKQNDGQAKRQKLDHPVREVSEHCCVEHHKKVPGFTVKKQFELLNDSVIAMKCEPVFFMKKSI